MPDLDWSKREKHTEIKHGILYDYLRAWITATAGSKKANFKTLYIVDGFAGRGEYENRDPGSPKIIITAACEKIKRYNCKINCFFIEKDKNLFSEMERV